METSRKQQSLQVKTSIKAGIRSAQHNQSARGLKVKTNVKAGAEPPDRNRLTMNHNQTAARGLKVKTNVKAGDPGIPGIRLNYSQTVAR